VTLQAGVLGGLPPREQASPVPILPYYRRRKDTIVHQFTAILHFDGDTSRRQLLMANANNDNGAGTCQDRADQPLADTLNSDASHYDSFST
jgi:hypothetical protein